MLPNQEEYAKRYKNTLYIVQNKLKCLNVITKNDSNTSLYYFYPGQQTVLSNVCIQYIIYIKSRLCPSKS